MVKGLPERPKKEVVDDTHSAEMFLFYYYSTYEMIQIELLKPNTKLLYMSSLWNYLSVMGEKNIKKPVVVSSDYLKGDPLMDIHLEIFDKESGKQAIKKAGLWNKNKTPPVPVFKIDAYKEMLQDPSSDTLKTIIIRVNESINTNVRTMTRGLLTEDAELEDYKKLVRKNVPELVEYERTLSSFMGARGQIIGEIVANATLTALDKISDKYEFSSDLVSTAVLMLAGDTS